MTGDTFKAISIAEYVVQRDLYLLEAKSNRDGYFCHKKVYDNNNNRLYYTSLNLLSDIILLSECKIVLTEKTIVLEKEWEWMPLM